MILIAFFNDDAIDFCDSVDSVDAIDSDNIVVIVLSSNDCVDDWCDASDSDDASDGDDASDSDACDSDACDDGDACDNIVDMFFLIVSSFSSPNVSGDRRSPMTLVVGFFEP